MKPRINMIGIITLQLEVMKAFYQDVLGFSVMMETDNFVEFENEGVRFALSTGHVMAEATGDASYLNQSTGHTLELAFTVDRPDKVNSMYTTIVANGATPIKSPANMPWGQRTAFFADPDGNIHEIFAAL